MKKSKFKRICVFCGSSQGKKSSYKDAAIELGRELVNYIMAICIYIFLMVSFHPPVFLLLHIFILFSLKKNQFSFQGIFCKSNQGFMFIRSITSLCLFVCLSVCLVCVLHLNSNHPTCTLFNIFNYMSISATYKFKCTYCMYQWVGAMNIENPYYLICTFEMHNSFICLCRSGFLPKKKKKKGKFRGFNFCLISLN